MKKLTDCDLAYKLPGDNPTFGELCREIGEIEYSRMLFVGDPRQSIMAFAGADGRSYDRIIAATDAQEFPLSVCYRCPTSHLDLARQEVPDIEARPGAPEGTIASVSEDELGDLVRAGDLVLCRMTAPLISWCFKLIERQIPAKVRGRDIGEELANLARKVGRGAPYKTFLARLGIYHRTHRAYLEQQEASESSSRMTTAAQLWLRATRALQPVPPSMRCVPRSKISLPMMRRPCGCRRCIARKACRRSACSC